MGWTQEAKKQWSARSRTLDATSSIAVSAYNKIDTWGNAIGKKQTKRFETGEPGLFCMVTAEDQMITQVTFDDSGAFEE